MLFILLTDGTTRNISLISKIISGMDTAITFSINITSTINITTSAVFTSGILNGKLNR